MTVWKTRELASARAIALAVAFAAASAFAERTTLRFCLPETIYAAPGVECNIYFESCFDSRTPKAYSYETRGAVGACETARWTWRPGAADAGRREELVLHAWNDTGLVSACTVTVQVAKIPADRTRRVTAAVLGDSLTNSRYQDQIQRAVRKAGWESFSTVGSRGGGNAAKGSNGEAKHDGYGGWVADSFLTQYKMTVDELDNLQAQEERKQLESIGVALPKGEEWRKHLLKSPFIRPEKGKLVVDVQMWLDRVNGGKAPDYILLYLGINGTCAQRDEKLAKSCSRTIRSTRKLVQTLRAAAPESEIVIGSCIPGCDQDAFASYGNEISAVQCHRNMFYLNFQYEKLVKELNAAGDARVHYIPVGCAIDPFYGYIAKREPPFAHSKELCTKLANAVHPSLQGGQQLGDAFAEFILCSLGEKGN